MNRLGWKTKAKKSFKVRERSQVTLSEEEQIRLIANLIIDRILEESEKGTLPIPIKI